MLVAVSTSDIAELYDRSDATALADAVRSGAVTPRELAEVALARIDERCRELNAIVAVRGDEALADLDAGRVPDGPLHGVPFLVKDLGTAVAGLPSTRGSRLWADAVATEDSELIRRYRQAGLVVLGTTTTPELGRSPSTEPLLHGPTRNPHDPSRSPLGSSGGSAVAVAAGVVPLAHGNDGGGSIRLPAAACGLVGLKPSRGRVPAAPACHAFAYPMGINHVLTRSVRDTALVLDLTAGAVAGSPYEITRPARRWAQEVGADPGRLRIALSTTSRDGSPVDPGVAAVITTTATALAELGHEVVEASPAYPEEELREAMAVVMSLPIALQIDRRLAQLGRELRDDDLEPFTRMMYDGAKAVDGVRAVAALEAVELAGRSLSPFFAEHDLLLTATVPLPPPPLGLLDVTDVPTMIRHAGQYASLTSPFNVTGQPAVSLPMGTDAGGLPVGAQLVASFGREDLLLQVAGQLEQACPWPTAPVWPAGAG